MVEVLDWQNATNQAAIVERAVAALNRGELVGFPTENGYGIAAHVLHAAAIERLIALAIRPDDTPSPLAIPDADQAADWVPDISPLGRRLAKRCWPGPVILRFADGIEKGLARQLPEPVRRHLCPDGALGLYVPEHDALWNVSRLLPASLVLAASPADREALPAAERTRWLGERVAFLIDDGSMPARQPAAVVRVEGNRWELLRGGTVSAEELSQQTTCLIVFVCTGNTCRSPMAEAICSKMLADRLDCSPAELPRRGFLVHSAGVAAVTGDRAAAEAVEAVRELGADLTRHASQPLTAELVHQADHLITMTRAHAAAVQDRFASYAPCPRLLCPEGNDIPDPIGADQETYRQCARYIQTSLERLLSELQS